MPQTEPEITVFAPAKVNLALHVTGRRADGYHLLDSLVVFAPFGDHLTIRPAQDMTLRVTGPEGAGVPNGPENLVLRAAAILAGQTPPETGAAITLHKALPAASGIGGGSSDAAAALRGLAHLWRCPPPGDAGLSLGADVPMCLTPEPAMARGIGEDLTPVTLPPLPAVLVNPRVSVSTPAVFRALTSRDNAPMAALPALTTVDACLSWLMGQRNDLELAAIQIAPEIGTTLTTLRALPGVRLARMSGSGATCFALFDTESAAQRAHDQIRRDHPDWWSACGALGDQRQASQPTSAAP